MGFKSLLRPFVNSELGMLLRNELDIRPIRHNLPSKSGLSFSDLHYWRVSADFETKFLMTDVVSEYLGVESARYFLTFLDSNGRVIFKKELEKRGGGCEQIIDSKFLGIESGHGTFYVTLICADAADMDLPCSLKNRWYCGYRGAKGPFSMVHGNTLVAWNSLDGASEGIGVTKSTIFRRFSYYLQVDPTTYDRVELVFVNPCARQVRVEFVGSVFILPPLGVVTVETSIKTKMSFRSNLLF
jgi:hypothetical protein